MTDPWSAADATGAASQPVISRFRPLSELVHRLVMRVVTWHRRRAAEGELNALDDFLLKDIGIARCQIPMIVDEMLDGRASGARRR